MKTGWVSIADEGDGWSWTIRVDGPRSFRIQETGLFEEEKAVTRAQEAAEIFGIHLREPIPMKDPFLMNSPLFNDAASCAERLSTVS